MAGFLYFVEGVAGVTRADLVAWGLGYAVEGPDGLTTRQTARGPHGGPGGVVVAVKGTAPQGVAVGLDTASQRWGRLVGREGGPAIAAGVWRDYPPTPAELQRRRLVRGATVEFGDGQRWQVPIVRHRDGEAWVSDLPSFTDCDEAGRPCRGDMLDEYRDLWERTTRVCDYLFALECRFAAEAEAGDDADDAALPPIPEPIGDADIVEAVVELLAANYRVRLPELAAAQVLGDDGSNALAIKASCMYDELFERLDAIKKNVNQSGSPG
jgi:hypothetical protein